MRRNQEVLGDLLIIEAKVALVGVVGEGNFLGVVVAESRPVVATPETGNVLANGW